MSILFRRQVARVFAAALLLPLSSCAVGPKVLDSEANRQRLEADLQATYDSQEKIERPVTLEDAMARAIRYNLDSRLTLMQEALSRGELGTARWDMLPRLAANAGYSHRSKYSASNSVNLDTGIESLSMSTSQDRDIRTADLTVVWNVLDFGVSYFQAKQNADRSLIMRERRRKAVHNLMQEVRQAYWQAAGAEKLRSLALKVLEASDKELERIRRQREERISSPIENLKQERALLDTMRQMQAILDELAVAKPRLAALMGLSPGASFELASVNLPEKAPGESGVPVDQLEKLALENRPEIREAAYQEHISSLEARKAIARILPGIELRGSKEYNSNSFAAYPNWWEGGISVAWNLMNIPSAPQRISTANTGKKVARANSLALSMAVLSQVYVSRQQQGAAIRQFELAKRQKKVEELMLWHVKAGHELQVLSDREYIQAAANAVKSELSLYMAYAAMDRAQANLYVSLGLDPFLDIDADVPLNRLADTIGRAGKAWQEGRFDWSKGEAERVARASQLYGEGVELFRREEYGKADSTFAALLAIDPLNDPARQFAEKAIPARLGRIGKARDFTAIAEKAAALQREGRNDEARELWNTIMTESKKELGE